MNPKNCREFAKEKTKKFYFCKTFHPTISSNVYKPKNSIKMNFLDQYILNSEYA